MKTLRTIYTNFAKRTAIILTLLLTLGATSAWGAEEIMYPNNGQDFNSNWNKTTRTARQTYAASTAAIQLMGENGGVYGEISSKNTYNNISAVSVKVTASKSINLTLYYSTDNSTWIELSSISVTKSTTSYSSKSFTITDIPSGAMYLKFRPSASSVYVYSVTVTESTATAYNITWNNGGHGTAPTSPTSAYSVELPSLTTTGYTHTGWTANVAVKNGSTTISTGELIENGTTVTLTQATTFTAQWEINSYKVTWEPNGGNWSGNASDKVEDYNYGATITTPTNPTRYGFNFTGWNPTPAITMPASDQIYTAQWTEKSLTNYRTTCSNKPSVSFALNGGSGSFNPEPLDGDSYTIPETEPTRNGYNFAGWKINGEGDLYQPGETINGITEPITLVAQWTAKTATSLTWSADTYTATIDADNTFPELTISPEAIKESVRYTSSEETVATIDANTGEITLKAAGTTTITATFTETATHAGSIDSYTLTVNPSNCRWVEAEIEDIESGDEVVVMMAHSTNLYALPYDENTASNSNPVATPIILNDFKGTISNTLIWYITKDNEGNNFTLSPKTATDKYLTCNKSSNAVRINTGENRNFTIENDFLKNTAFSTYLAISTAATPKDWRHFESTNTTISSRSQTLKFYKRECLDSEHYWVEGNLTNVTCDTQLPQQLAKNSSITLTFTAADGYVLPNTVTVTNAAKTWNQTTGELTISNPTGNVMVTVEAVELHTITWKVGSNSVHTEEVANNTGVTTTPDTPANDAIGNCADAFVGWSETPLGSAEGQSAPADLCTAAQMKLKHTSVTGDKTFYAVFASAEGGNDYVQISSENDLVAGSKYLIVGNSSSTYKALPVDKATNLTSVSPSSSKISNPADELIWTLEGTVDKWKFKSASNNKYLQISGDNLTFVESTALTFDVTVSSSIFTFTSSASSGNKILSYYHSGDPSRFNAYNKPNTVYIYKQDVSYSNYVTNCCETPAPTNGTFDNVTGSGNAMSLTLNWEGSVSRYHITCANPIIDDHIEESTSYNVSSLTECEEYTFYVSAAPAEGCESAAIQITAQPFSGAKTVNYDYNGGSGSPESFTTSCDDDKREIILPVATRPGYTFEGWYDSEENKVGIAGATYDPATSPITLYAHWTENIYQLTHNGSNYTNTENKTSIKSSETPFTLHYTCTDDYGLPATISITGGKSWTVGTDYTWEVAADKQSATLVIKETVISADVTITINVATRYTVTFVHNDKGVFSGSETIEVLSSENTITLPTVTDVSCGFYDTFEGWIEANEDYTESTSKPATIYKGGANYTVNSDCTLRALYSKCEGDATQVYRKVTTTGDVTDGTYILVANTATPLVYSGHTEGKDYGDCISGLIADDSDFSSTLPDGAVPVTVSVGVSGFSIHNGTKFIEAGTSTGVSDNASYWQLTDGSQVDSKTCPPGVLQPVNNTTHVLQKNNQYNRFKTYENSQSAHVFLYKLIDKCTKYYSTNPSCEKPVGVRIFYNANAADADMSCIEQNRTYKVENDVNKYPQLASQLQFCTNATREGYTLVGWNTQANGQGTTYNINQNYYTLPVSGELDGEKRITLNLYAMWKPCIKFNLGNAIGGTGVPDVVVENGECVLPEPTAEQLGTIPCGYEFYAWSETSVDATQTKPALFMPGDTYSGDALTLYAVYRWCEGNTGSDTYYFTFIVDDKTYCITQKHNNYDRFVVAEATSGLIFGLENGYLYYLDEGVKTFVYWEGSSTTVTTTTTYPNADTQKTTFVEGDNGTTIVTPAILGRYLQMPSSDTDRAYYMTDGINPTLVEVQSSICTYATNPTCYTNTNLHFVTNGGTLNYPTDYDGTNYQELAVGSTVFLPTATFAGEWTFEGWKRGSQLESQTTKPYDPSFYPVTLNSTQFEVDDLGDIYFYAVYSKTNDDKQFDPVNGGTYKLFAIGADGTKTYMPVWTGTRGTPSGVTTCAETGDYTITPGTDTHAGQYQITCGEYTLGVVSGGTDLNKVEGTWWNIEPSTSGKGTWRITVAGSTDDRALICSFSTAKSFGNYAISNLNGSAQTIYRDMEIGECIYTEYTSTPENIPYITITGAPVKITSTNGERIYAPTTLHIEAHNFTGGRIIHLSATNGFGVYPEQVRTNGQGAYSGDVKVYYEPTTDGDGQTITTSVFTASQTGGTNDEKISQTFTAIQGRNMPANFVIAAKWDGLWYALPANCTTSNSSTEGLLIEVDDVDNPTMATSAPASAKYGIREVIPSRQTDYGQGIVFTERFAEGDKQFALYNGSNANIQVNAQYSNYAQTNPDKYEWIPSTSDFKDYTLTNASTGRNLGLTSGTFGAYTAASNQVRLLPATFYEPAPVQVLKWKANSVIVMYTGAETTATTQVGTNAVSAAQTLENQKLTHGIYELSTTQALTGYARDVLVLYFGANTKVEMEIPLIVSGNVTASADGHDVVILENSKLTAAATKYSYKDVYVYGGAKLAIPTGTTLGVNNIILRAGGVATNGAGKEATYQYIYPQVELKGTLTSSVQNIRYEYVTDYDHWYHLALPFDGSLASIHYPTEYYGDQVKLDNTGSWQIKRYAGEIRATGNYDAWKDIEEDNPKATQVIAGKGYIYWGAPKKITANDVYDRPTWGIQRITMSVTAPNAMTAENGDKAISGLSSYVNVEGNSRKDNDQGWNLIGNPYMVNLTDMATTGLHACKLVEVIDPVTDKWNGKWEWNDETTIRYLTIPSEHFDTYTAKTVTQAVPLVPGRAFFVQLEGEADGVTFSAANRASLMPQHLAAQNTAVEVETGIVLSSETMQDEVNFWIKDGKTNDYEYNADYPKTPNNTNFNIYGVHAHGDLSWVAISPELAAESMPIGYQVPAAGTYMLSLSETYYSEDLESLYVTDHEMSPEVTVDLINAPYEFSVNQAETNNERFTISLKLKSEIQGPTTGWENIDVGKDHPTKFIHQDRLYILRDGVIYDATGQEIQTINK